MAERWQVAWRLALPIGRALVRFGFRMEVRGRERLAAGPTVIAVNHCSFLDPPLVGMGLQRPMRFLAVHDLWGQHRVLDGLINAFGAVPLRNQGRPVRALRLALGHLAEGGTVGIFPEGQRVEEFGSETVREGAAWLAVRSGSPLTPLYVHGSEWSLSLRHPPFRLIPVDLVVGDPLDPKRFGTGRGAVTALTAAWEQSMWDLKAEADRLRPGEA